MAKPPPSARRIASPRAAGRSARESVLRATALPPRSRAACANSRPKPREEPVTQRRCTPPRCCIGSDSVHSGQVGTCTSRLGTKATAAGNATDRASISRSRTGNECPCHAVAYRHPGQPQSIFTAVQAVQGHARCVTPAAHPRTRQCPHPGIPGRRRHRPEPTAAGPFPPGESAGHAPPATRARACAHRGPLHGTRERIARVPVKRLDRGNHRLSHRSCA